MDRSRHGPGDLSAPVVSPVFPGPAKPAPVAHRVARPDSGSNSQRPFGSGADHRRYAPGIGPVAAVPKALKLAGLKQNDIEQVELNEAFAAQALGVIGQLDLDPDLINVNGGAIALGHPLGCTGAKLSVQLLNEMRRRGQKYGVVTACVGGGQGVAGIYERLN